MLYRILFTCIYSVLFLGLSGITGVVNAATSCHELIAPGASAYKYSDSLVHFVFYGGKTYAISKSAVTGNTTGPHAYFAFSANIDQQYKVTGVDTASLRKLLSLGKFGDAAPVTIPDEETMQWLLSQYRQFLGQAGSSQISYVNAWKEFGANSPFTLITGNPLGYSNWPGGMSPPVETISEPQAVSMGADGVWLNGTTDQILTQIVEFNSKLDCAVDLSTIPTIPDPDPDPPPSTTDICVADLNGNGDIEANETTQCVSTPQGMLCPIGAVSCQGSGTDPVCPAGSVLDPIRDMCQADPTANCGAGYTYDAALDLCVTPVQCPEGGTFSALNNRCEKLVTNECPATYTYDSMKDVCWKAVECPGGSFVAGNDRCEAPVGNGCSDPSYTFNAALDRCEKDPICALGTYNNTYDRCLLNFTVGCPSGYTYNTSSKRCERTPLCSQGTFNPLTNNCEWTTQSSYPATGTTTGGVNFTVPIYLDGSISASTCYTNGKMGSAGCGGIYGYMAASSFPDSVAIYKTGGMVSTSCYPDGNFGVSGCGGVAGYISSSEFLNSGPVYRHGAMFGSSCILNTYIAGVGQQGCGPVIGFVAATPGVHGGTTTYSCNPGDTLVGTSCYHDTLNQISPTCPSGTLDFAAHLCFASYTPECPVGMTFDSAIQFCYQTPECLNGALDIVQDRCYQVKSGTCTSPWTLDGASNICFSPPVCLSGSYNAQTDQCQATVTNDCGSYTWSAIDNKCILGVTCPSDLTYSLNSTVAFSEALDACASETEHGCPVETSYNGQPVMKCEAVPVCAQGSYDPVMDKCYAGDSCPADPQLTCMDYQGSAQCSPNRCFNPDDVSDAEEETMDETMLQDDARNPDGTCGGQILVFNGKASRCRPPGLKVGMINNCCESDTVMTEDTGNTITNSVQAIRMAYQIGQVAYYTYMASMGTATVGTMTAAGTVTVAMGATTTTLSGAVASGVASGAAAATGGATTAGAMTASMQAYVGALLNPATIAVAIVIMVVMKVLFGSGCDQGDIQTGMQSKAKQCHYLGDYCQTKWFGSCVQKAKGFCCFNSVMARIIHEQGRPQLTSFGASGGWGTPESPECRGFTPAEFEALDFARIDLSEYYQEIQDGLTTKLDNAEEKINTTIQNRLDQMSQ